MSTIVRYSSLVEDKPLLFQNIKESSVRKLAELKSYFSNCFIILEYWENDEVIFAEQFFPDKFLPPWFLAQLQFNKYVVFEGKLTQVADPVVLFSYFGGSVECKVSQVLLMAETLLEPEDGFVIYG